MPASACASPSHAVHLSDLELSRRLGGLLPVFESLMPVHFDDGPALPDACRGQIQTPQSRARVLAPADEIPTLLVPAPSTSAETSRPTQLRFADDPRVPWPFRGSVVDTPADLDGQALAQPLQAGEFPLAWTREGSPVWTVQTSAAVSRWRTSLRLPLAQLGQDVGLAAAGGRFIQLLPLMQFLRDLTQGERFVDPPLRASFIIDDPNLHWPSYGHVDYRVMAASARRDRYHVAFATIPLDAWWVHPGAAHIFGAHPGSLSLAVHGNNHGPRELAAPLPAQDCHQVLRQASARIAQLEARSGLCVSRVMIPPHGACSSQMLSLLPRHGFEAACISAGSLRAHNPGEAWTRTLGFSPSEWVRGCPVLPRWALGTTRPMDLLSAAYLGQPLVLRGHHQDLKHGLDLLKAFAQSINALGTVRWGDLRTLSRLNYRHRTEGDTLHIVPLGNRLDIPVPQGIRTLRISAGGLPWRTLGAGAVPVHRRAQDFVVRPTGPGVCSLVRLQPPVAAAEPQRTRITPPRLIVRRALTEARDRLLAW